MNGLKIVFVFGIASRYFTSYLEKENRSGSKRYIYIYSQTLDLVPPITLFLLLCLWYVCGKLFYETFIAYVNDVLFNAGCYCILTGYCRETEGGKEPDLQPLS